MDPSNGTPDSAPRRGRWGCESGLTLIEVVISVALLGIIATALLATISAGLRVSLQAQDQTTSATLATSQIEQVLSEAYVEPPDYAAVQSPEGFSVGFDNLVIEPTLLEEIAVGISTAEKQLFEVRTRKANEEFVASPPTLLLAQRDYAWYENADALTPTSALREDNTPHALTGVGQTVRLRMSVQVDGVQLPATSETFRLQYATDKGGPWTEVGGVGSASIWRGADNAAVADGAALASGLLATSDSTQTYEEANPSATNPVAVSVGEWTEWDWVVQENGAPLSTSYLFRMVRAGGTPLESYTRYPTVSTPPPITFEQHDYRWHSNADALTPGSPLAAENTPYSTSTGGLTYRLRLNVEVDGYALLAGGQAFKLQHSTSTSGPWADVGDPGSAAVWRGADNPSVSDGATGAGPLLTTSDVFESYEEANPSANNPTAVGVADRGEWDWVVQDNGAPSDTYYFRLAEADGTVLDSYVRYAVITR